MGRVELYEVFFLVVPHAKLVIRIDRSVDA